MAGKKGKVKRDYESVKRRDKLKFLHNERDVARWMGVSYEMLRDRRSKHLVPYEDFVLDWKVIWYSKSGLDKAYELFGIEQKVMEALPDEEISPDVSPIMEAVVAEEKPKRAAVPLPPGVAQVMRCNYPNKSLMLGRLSGEDIWIRVRDARVFRPGLRVAVTESGVVGWYVGAPKPLRGLV